jgi:hypothetical protein
MDHHVDGSPLTFDSTSGRVMAVLTALLGGLAVVAALVSDAYPTAVGAAGLLAVVLAWPAMLRPRVRLDDGFLVLRGMFSTVHLPLAALQSVVVQQVLVATVDDKRYANPGVGRSRFRAMRKPRSTRDLTMTAVPGEGWTPDEGADYADFVEDRIREAAKAARRAGDAPTGVRRDWAWLEIALVAGCVLLLVVTLWL